MDDAPQQRTAASAPTPYVWFEHRPWFLALVLVVVTFVAYQPTWHAGFIWDDDSYVTENRALQSLDGLGRIWVKPGTTKQYYPLVFTTFWAEYHLWKLQPLGYHLVNVLLHSLNAVLLWCVLRRMEVPGAWWAAAIFALHPVCVESVAWITERKNVLSGLFYFLAALAYLRFRPLNDRDAARICDWRYYPLVLVLFLCALLSKTVTCSLPAALVLLAWWKTGRVERRDVLALAPLFVLGVASGFMTTWMEEHRVGASGAEWALSFAQRCLVAGRALWFYAGKLLWPRNLTFIYPHWEIDAGAPWQYLFPLAAVAALIALWRLRSRIGRGPLVAVLFFAGTLMPALGFFDVYPFRFSFVADHFQYLACIGLICLGASTGRAIWERAGQRGRDLGTGAAAIALLILGASTWRQARIYHDLKTLWGDTLMKNPQCWMAHNNLGTVVLREGKVSDAIGHYEQALRIKSDYVDAHNSLGIALAQTGKIEEAIAHYEQALRIKADDLEAHNNLGNALLRLGKVQEAVLQYDQALRIKPDSAEAHSNLGGALFRLGRIQEAIGECEQALRIKPDFAEAHNNLGNALLRLGKVQEAVVQYDQALRVEPDFAEAHYNLALALVEAGRAQEAIGHYEQVLRLKPGDRKAHFNLGLALWQAGRLREAIGQYEQALRINPDFTEAHVNLGIALSQLGSNQDALAHFMEALRLRPDSPEVHYNLGQALLHTGRVTEAVEHFEQALRLKPDYAEAHYNLGIALQGQGRVPEAIEQYEQALKLRPDFTPASNALSRLRGSQ